MFMANSQPAISEPNKPTETQSNYTRKLNIETQKKKIEFWVFGFEQNDSKREFKLVPVNNMIYLVNGTSIYKLAVK